MVVSTTRRLATALAVTAALVASACRRPVAEPAGTAQAEAALPSRARREALRRYIHDAWAPLTRTLAALPEAAVDPKSPHEAGAPWPVYIPRDEDPLRIDAALGAVMPPVKRATITLRPLPANPADVRVHGLLYLPRPYVVPGGRFNEMYGWDSYFILLGLLADGQRQLATDVTDDFLYEVRRYGGVLNANRTYYLTRGQPPFLSEMVLAVYRATGDKDWLRRARDAVVAEHAHWTAPPHLVREVGLSRYFDHGSGPAPEVVTGEVDAAGTNHYQRAQAWYRAHGAAGQRGDAGYDVTRFYDRQADALTALFYLGDRSMRESGFDPTDRFGRFGVDVIDYTPVCLNTLLYAMENDLAEIDRALGDTRAAAKWTERAAARRALLDAYLWDERAGLYLDYDFRTRVRRDYPFATTFWPLWAGAASPAQAARVRANLPTFERPGGVVTSTRVSGSQWDAPFGWAPLQLFAVEGLRRYGYAADADRVARDWLSMLVEDFERRGTLLEKYDVVRRTSRVEGKVAFGYESNEIGFGWTNGVALLFLDGVAAAP
jgi:alpha,alpha-trehalase